MSEILLNLKNNENIPENSSFYLEIILKFIIINNFQEISFEIAKGSVNNIIRYFLRKNQKELLIRIYNNGNNKKKIQFEHFIINKINNYKKNFKVPKALKYIQQQQQQQDQQDQQEQEQQLQQDKQQQQEEQQKEEDQTILQLNNGTYASVFEIIEGYLPGLELTREIGKACGELSLIFEDITKNLTSEEISNITTPPYYDIYSVHEDITKEIFLNEVSLNIYDSCRSDLNFLVDKILELENKIEQYHQYNLPIQLIHGDLHYDNILAIFDDENEIGNNDNNNDNNDDNNDNDNNNKHEIKRKKRTGRITGILDFEFCALDWKAMELAICLSKYLAQPNPMPYLIDFIEGYVEGTSSNYLTPLECSLLPSLIELRILSNIVFFVARIRAKQESIDILINGKIHDYYNRIHWIESNKTQLIDILDTLYH